MQKVEMTTTVSTLERTTAERAAILFWERRQYQSRRDTVCQLPVTVP